MSVLEILEIFEELFVDSFASKPEIVQAHRCFIISENTSGAKLKEVNIRDVPEHSVLLRTQNCPPLNNVFKSTEGKRKMCDYILLTSYKDNLYFIFIEMKSQSRDNRDIISQFKGGNCFMMYCAAVADKFHSAHIPEGLLKTRNIVFHADSRFGKNPTHFNNMRKSVSTPSTFSEEIIRISLNKEKAFAFFEHLILDMAEDIRNA